MYDTSNAALYPCGFPGGHATVHRYRLLPPYSLYACHVESDVCTTMSERDVSSRTTNGTSEPSPLSLRTRCATYTPDTAVDGTVHDADVDQFPQSTRPVDDVV